MALEVGAVFRFLVAGAVVWVIGVSFFKSLAEGKGEKKGGGRGGKVDVSKIDYLLLPCHLLPHHRRRCPRQQLPLLLPLHPRRPLLLLRMQLPSLRICFPGEKKKEVGLVKVFSRHQMEIKSFRSEGSASFNAVTIDIEGGQVGLMRSLYDVKGLTKGGKRGTHSSSSSLSSEGRA